jgi:uncharacterized lipoprotein YehR (DUF1307 family)
MNPDIKKQIMYQVLKFKFLRFLKFKDLRISCDGYIKFLHIFKDDEEVMTYVLDMYNYWTSHKFVSYRLKDDEQFVRKNIYRIHFPSISKRLRDKENFVFDAVKCNYQNFEYVSERLRSNFDLFMIAYTKVCNKKECKYILHSAGDKIKNDRDIMLKISEIKNSYLIEYIPVTFRLDKEIMKNLIKYYPDHVSKFPPELLKDKEFIKEIIKINPLCYNYLEKISEFFHDKDITLFTLKQDGCLLKDISNKFKKDLSVVITAVEQTGYAFRYVDDSLKENNIVLFKTISQGKQYLKYTPNYIHKGEFRKFIEGQILYNQGLITFFNWTVPIPSNTCVLTKIYSHGPHFAKNFKKKIRSYITDFIGKEKLEIEKVALIYKII